MNSSMVSNVIVRVALDCPMPTLFDYRCPITAGSLAPLPGQLVHVPFGKRRLVGLICEVTLHSDVSSEQLREIEAIWTDCPPLSHQWRALVAFAADYYQRTFGEVALPALPRALRNAGRWHRLLAAVDKSGHAQRNPQNPQNQKNTTSAQPEGEQGLAPYRLNVEQASALDQLTAARGFAPFLLHGVTGSGKTEVYLQTLAALLARSPSAQALVLVPEISLTPQLITVFQARFAAWRADAIVTLHSGLAEGERARHWLAAHRGRARIVLGTRLSVLVSLPQLALIIVDEEHDAAYKQQEGLRYSARDLAIWRAQQLKIPIVLGSATPSLETWRQAERRYYTRLTLTQRARPEAALPTIQLIDINTLQQRGQPLTDGFSVPLIAALRERFSKREQSLVFLNRRGYAPVLACDACGWIAGCYRCSAYIVMHKLERVMCCHHCGWQTPIPYACPACGNLDLAPLGRGTQRIEETLAALVPGAQIVRIDADSTRRKGSAQALFAQVHTGNVDILIGTQMITKGHDFKHITLVGVLNADAALFSQDFRAGERLFAQLMQVSGRTGRAGGGEVFIQTRYPQHPLYDALIRHDYVGFAATMFAERQQARLPPFVYQALLRAEARTLDAALTFLAQGAATLEGLPGAERVTHYDPVPMTLAKVKHVHRAQLLVESPSRAALQSTLRAWQTRLRLLKGALRGILRWSVEVDPIEL